MERVKGLAMIIVGASLWGLSGPMMEWTLEHSSMSVSFLLTVRLLTAGLLLIAYLKIKGKQVTRPWRQKVWARQMVIFGVVGMLGVQFSFTSAIAQSNAVIATLFQFLSPIYVILFVSLRQRFIPPVAQILGMFVTLGGLFLLLTNGSLSGFSLSPGAVFWGIAVGFAFTFYTLYPVRLMQEWGVLLSIGWAMVIGGAALLITNPVRMVREIRYLFDWKISLMLLGIIVVGTVAFLLFLASMKFISPIETSILSSFEPLTAMIVSVIWLGAVLGAWQLTGAIVMLLGVTGISIAGGRVKT
ncbi:DMT family transporter [Sporosarcina gallistercoris]|uniref:EamA family transporter n=1 Tax=Sporosarcina gallistercoris TaxID=2762245 RepID=UPI003D2D9CAE